MEKRWLEIQLRHCTKHMEASLSATQLRMERPGFGQTIVPKAGSVLASPVYANWDPEPDYFFHWLRDSAIAMDAVTLLSAAAEGEGRQRWNNYFRDFVRFSLKVSTIKGTNFKKKDRARVSTEFMKWVRPKEEMALLKDDFILAEPRVNPDGTPDFQRWSRPQYDGPALRALTCLRHWDEAERQNRAPSKMLLKLLLQDLDFTANYADKPCIGPWEEDEPLAHHYPTCVAQAGALYHGALWAQSIGDFARVARYRETSEMILRNLDQHWDEENKFYRAERQKIVQDPEEALDISVIMGALHARLPDGRHSIHDDRIAATLSRLEALFERKLPINHKRSETTGLAMGRNKTDKFQGGGAWYPCTLAIAEYHYRLGNLGKGDAVMNMIQNVIPEDGSMTEQFDKVSGEPRSARHLTWSYAAFITAAMARSQSVKESPAFTSIKLEKNI